MPVLKHFKKYIEDNSVHALDLKCMTPEQSSEMGNTTFLILILESKSSLVST